MGNAFLLLALVSALLAGQISLEAAAKPSSAKVNRTAVAESGSTELVVLFYADVEDGIVDGKLLAAGFQMMERPDLLRHQRLVRASLAQMLSLTEWSEVAYIYPASEDLVNGVPVLGCPGPAIEEGEVANYVSNVGNGWLHDAELKLTYSVSKGTSQIPDDVLMPAIEKALAEWSRFAKIQFRFTRATTAERNINFLFATGSHGDSYAFDGPGRVLAHTFYPAGVNREPVAGDVHIDDDELWANRMNPDLYSVILHEVGHALGLGHADRPGSIMYPYYRKLVDLQADDIAALRRLYPAREAALSPEEAQPNVSPEETSNSNNVTVAALQLKVQAPESVLASSVSLSGNILGGTAPFQLSWHAASHTGSMTAGLNWSIPSIPLSLGVNTVTLVVVDAAGASHEAKISVRRSGQEKADKTAPQLTITSPSLSLSSTSAATMKVTGTAKDAGGLDLITYSASSGQSGTASGTSTWSIEGISLLQGDNVIVVTAKDAAGNLTKRTVTITRR